MGSGWHGLNRSVPHAIGDLHVDRLSGRTESRPTGARLWSGRFFCNSVRTDCLTKTNSAVFEKWNKKNHIYLSLFLLLFLWIFCVSGLFLNHPEWFHGKPERTSVDKPVDMLDGGDQITKARHLMDQLDLKGEAFFQCAPTAGVSLRCVLTSGRLLMSILKPRLPKSPILKATSTRC